MSVQNHIDLRSGKEMAKGKVVNLDALIPREDFSVGDGAVSAFESTNEINMSMLRDEFFGTALRKPDYQRETAAWTPTRVYDFIKSFVDGDLVPAVILWKGGEFNFVVDGAHRLSCLLAYIHDDYGDGRFSRSNFRGAIPPEQIKIAKETRALIDREIGSYQHLKTLGANRSNKESLTVRRINAIGQRIIPSQWVPAKDADAAEASFFKINQAATALDPTEKVILKMRKTASSIAARSIARGGSGHAYWQHFDSDFSTEIPKLGQEIHDLLFKPELVSGSLTQTEFPLGGVGYNVLQLSFELVNRLNSVGNLRANISEDRIRSHVDTTGEKTVEFLKAVKKRVAMMAGTDSRCLGINPLVYVYSAAGEYQSSAFFGFLNIAQKYSKGDDARRFQSIRKSFEDHLVENKQQVSELIHKIGGRRKSDSSVERYFEKVIGLLLEGRNVNENLKSSEDYSFLFHSPKLDHAGVGKSFNRRTRNSVAVADYLANRRSCQLCGGALQANSQHVDHRQRKRDGGSNTPENGQIVHPICNSLKS